MRPCDHSYVIKSTLGFVIDELLICGAIFCLQSAQSSFVFKRQGTMPHNCREYEISNLHKEVTVLKNKSCDKSFNIQIVE